jgi:solute carrier family 25 carnitine/acylcarnitine transporter 20/29
VSSLLVPEGALQITPEKHLLAMRCTSFVSLIHSTDLTHLINNTEVKSTILAPSDDVISILGDAELPERGSLELERMLRYHFIPGRWLPKKLENGTLLETELVEEGLQNGRQVLPVEVNEEVNSAEGSKKSITFGGVSILNGPSKQFYFPEYLPPLISFVYKLK